ncbi:MAG: hypothetical protein PF444_04250, partial [Bacteroidales bacterium]|nr:hypothetical protein [Bacteroidales bacterium]
VRVLIPMRLQKYTFYAKIDTYSFIFFLGGLSSYPLLQVSLANSILHRHRGSSLRSTPLCRRHRYASTTCTAPIWAALTPVYFIRQQKKQVMSGEW